MQKEDTTKAVTDSQTAKKKQKTLKTSISHTCSNSPEALSYDIYISHWVHATRGMSNMKLNGINMSKTCENIRWRSDI